MKHIISFAAATLCVIAASAQSNEDLTATADSLQNGIDNQERVQKEKSIWGKGRYINLAYATNDYAAVNESPSHSSWSFALTKGAVYNFPKHALGGVVKIGIDARWFDLQVTKFKGIDESEWSSQITFGDEYEEDLPSLGEYLLTVGVGIGPRVTVAPLSMLNNAARYLKASIYFHYRPSFSAYLLSQDGDAEVSTGFFNMFDFGGCLTYRAVTLGVEGNWGSGKTSAISFDEDLDFGGKIKNKIASTRFYISFAF